MHDLIYNRNCVEFLKTRFLEGLKIDNTGNENYPERFSVEIGDNHKKDYYKFLIKKGFAGASLDIVRMLKSEKGRKFLENLVGEIKREPIVI